MLCKVGPKIPMCMLALCMLNLFGRAQQAQGTPQGAPPPGNPAMPQQQLPWSQHFRNSTVSLGRILENDGQKQFDVLGTGVLIVKKTPTHAYVALATARHVVADEQSSWHPSALQIRFASEESKPLNQDLGYELQLTDNVGRPLWTGSADDTDIAIIPLSAFFWSHLREKAITDAIAIQEFASDTDAFEGESIEIFGFPGDVSVLMGPNALVRAVTRSGIVSWIDPITPDGAFMIDANILQGNSGGPVFTNPGALDQYGNLRLRQQPMFLGIVTSTIGNEYVRSLGGLGRVERASKIATLFLSMLPPWERN